MKFQGFGREMSKSRLLVRFREEEMGRKIAFLSCEKPKKEGERHPCVCIGPIVLSRWTLCSASENSVESIFTSGSPRQLSRLKFFSETVFLCILVEHSK